LGRKNKHWSIRQVGRIFHVLFSISEPLHSPSLSLSLSLGWATLVMMKLGVLVKAYDAQPSWPAWSLARGAIYNQTPPLWAVS
jgi:hypothetical protein